MREFVSQLATTAQLENKLALAHDTYRKHRASPDIGALSDYSPESAGRTNQRGRLNGIHDSVPECLQGSYGASN